MKRITPLLAAMLCLAAAARAGEQSADGAKTYAAKCASCHAKDGKGNPAMEKMLKAAKGKLSLVSAETIKKEDAALIKTTTDGSGKMPAFKEKLKSEEIASVIAYVRSMAKPEKPAAAKTKK